MRVFSHVTGQPHSDEDFAEMWWRWELKADSLGVEHVTKPNNPDSPCRAEPDSPSRTYVTEPNLIHRAEPASRNQTDFPELILFHRVEPASSSRSTSSSRTCVTELNLRHRAEPASKSSICVTEPSALDGSGTKPQNYTPGPCQTILVNFLCRTLAGLSPVITDSARSSHRQSGRTLARVSALGGQLEKLITTKTAICDQNKMKF